MPHCASYAASVTSSQQPSFNRLSLRWSSAGWTMVMVRWLVCQPILSVDSSRFRTQRQVSYSGSVAMTTLLTRSSVSTSYETTSAGKDLFKVAKQTYRALQGDAPQYLRQFTSVADTPSRQRLRSSSSDHLLVPVVRLSTVGRRAFPVADARIWNDLPSDVTSSPSLFTFKRRLKMHLFRLSYPDLTF